MSARALLRAKRIAASTMRDGRPLIEDRGVRAKLARMECRLEALKMANYRAIAGAKHGHAPGAESSNPQATRQRNRARGFGFGFAFGFGGFSAAVLTSAEAVSVTRSPFGALPAARATLV